MDAQELELIERRMQEEHRLDREALERLKRFLHPSKNGHNPPVVKPTNPASGKDDAETAAVYTIISKVAEVMIADPARSWNGPDMVAKLASEGMPIAAKRPVPAVTRAFRKLVKRGIVRRVKKGVGTIPSAYRAIEQSSQSAAAS
jgi:hypothetical protein